MLSVPSFRGEEKLENAHERVCSLLFTRQLVSSRSKIIKVKESPKVRLKPLPRVLKVY